MLVFQSLIHDVSMVVLPPLYYRWGKFFGTKLLHTSSGAPVVSFRHKMGISRFVEEWVNVSDVAVYMQHVNDEGPCEEPVFKAPPCGAQPSVAPTEVADPVMRELAQKLSPHELPPYAPSTVAAFEAANNMTFPADLKWFLTHVARSLQQNYDFVALCEPEEDLDEDTPEVMAEMIRLLPGNPRATTEVAMELVALRRNGGTDSNRVLRRIHPHAVWDTRKTSITPFLKTLRVMGKLSRNPEGLSSFSRDLHDRCKAIGRRVEQLGIPVDMGPLWAGRKEAQLVGDVDTVDDTDPYCPGRMLLANFGCQCDVHLVVRGPFQGSITYMYQVNVREKRTVFPSFTSFVAIVCNDLCE
jgi:hypothetical protein